MFVLGILWRGWLSHSRPYCFMSPSYRNQASVWNHPASCVIVHRTRHSVVGACRPFWLHSPVVFLTWTDKVKISRASSADVAVVTAAGCHLGKYNVFSYSFLGWLVVFCSPFMRMKQASVSVNLMSMITWEKKVISTGRLHFYYWDKSWTTQWNCDVMLLCGFTTLLFLTCPLTLCHFLSFPVASFLL